MALINQGGSLLLRNGALGTGQGCCCNCPPGRACGEECCPEGEECIAEQCCPEERACGEECCPEGETCVAEQCCPEERVCGEECCAEGETCVDGECVPCPEDRVCGEECCKEGEQCLNDELCCPEARVCGDECCAEGETCIAEQCCPPNRVCGDECCAEGETCVNEQCVPVECPTDGTLVLPQDVFATVKIDLKCLLNEDLKTGEEFSATLTTNPGGPILFGAPFQASHGFLESVPGNFSPFFKRAYLTLDCSEGKMRLRFLYCMAARFFAERVFCVPEGDVDYGQTNDMVVAGVGCVDMWCSPGLPYVEASSVGHTHIGPAYDAGGDSSQWQWLTGKEWNQTVYIPGYFWDGENWITTNVIEAKAQFKIDGIG